MVSFFNNQIRHFWFFFVCFSFICLSQCGRNIFSKDNPKYSSNLILVNAIAVSYNNVHGAIIQIEIRKQPHFTELTKWC